MYNEQRYFTKTIEWNLINNNGVHLSNVGQLERAVFLY